MNRTKPSETKLLVFARSQTSRWEPAPELAMHLRARWPEMRVAYLPTADGLDRELPDTDILLTRSLPAQEFAMARQLKWVHSFAAGVAHMMYPEIRQSGIEMTNASSVHCVPIAEHVVGTLIALSRRFPDCFRYQQQAKWMQQEIWNAPIGPRELRGQVILFVGFGAIGRAVATLLKPMDMHVWAVTRSGKSDPDMVEKSFSTQQLHEALPGADFIVIAAPDIPETRGMIGAAEIALMKRSAYLVNVARGVIIDEAALIAALERRAIAGAALDVTSVEPLASDSPLWKLDNAFITPHVSALGEHIWARQQQLVTDNLERWFSGRELLERVDLERGY